MTKYNIFSTTADVGVDVWGRSYSELCRHAVQGLHDLVFGSPFTVPDNTVSIPFSFKGDCFENVLVNVLNEVIFILETRDLCVFDMEVKQGSAAAVTGRFLLYKPESAPCVEIKAVTYHGIRVEKVGDRMHIRVVCDI